MLKVTGYTITSTGAVVAAPTYGPAGSDVQHMPGCICSEVDKSDPAVMWDLRMVLPGLQSAAMLSELELYLAPYGLKPACHYDHDDIAIRCCEVLLIWRAQKAARRIFVDVLSSAFGSRNMG